MRLVRVCVPALLLFACGGPGSKTPHPIVDGGADAEPAHLVSTLPTDVRNPPPFHLGSKHAAIRAHDEWGACHAAFHPNGDPAKAVLALGNACAAVTKMHAAGSPMTGSQNAVSSLPSDYSFRGQAKHCYRVYAVAGSGVKSLVAVFRDDAGAQIAEYHTDDVSPFFAPDEAICFSDDANVKVAVSVGIGDGPYALSVWSE